jgi:PIN domain nuclease of toxin-antitoxin system
VNVFDASALLAYLQAEDGAEAVKAGRSADGTCGTAHWSEVAQKIGAHGRDRDLARSLLASYDFTSSRLA